MITKNEVISAKSLYPAWSSEPESVRVIDFRAAADFQKCHVPRSENFNPLDFMKVLFQSDPDVLTVVIFDPGQSLTLRGLHNAIELDGGLPAWRALGFPTVAAQSFQTFQPICQKQTHGDSKEATMNTDPESQNFVPKGAIAFFGAVITTMAIVWIGAYFIMIGRA